MEATGPSSTFFNYHEHLDAFSRLINTFPNPYVDPTSREFATTMVLRIPRVYNTSKYLIPQYSSYFPGMEPGGEQVPSSVLKKTLQEEELHTVVTKINAYLQDAFNPFNAINILEHILGYLTFWLSDFIIYGRANRVLDDLDCYIAKMNETWKTKNIEIVPLRKSSFLSLDLIIYLDKRSASSAQ